MFVQLQKADGPIYVSVSHVVSVEPTSEGSKVTLVGQDSPLEVIDAVDHVLEKIEDVWSDDEDDADFGDDDDE